MAERLSNDDDREAAAVARAEEAERRVATLTAAVERLVFFEAAIKAKQYSVSSVAVAELFEQARAALSVEAKDG